MRILLVEDDRKMNELVRRYLSDVGYAVDTAFDGQAALEQAQFSDYDALILDLLLPRLDGFSVCRELRRLGSMVPILMLTARDEVDDRVNGLDSGADDYLVKPFALRELTARLRALVRRRTERRPQLVVADLTINPATREVWRGDQRIDLNPKEYAVLEHLARHHGQIITRSGLEEHVWSYDHQPLSNTVDVHIGRLRRKIDDDYPRKLLETVRGVGYRLRDPGENAL